MKNVVIGTSGHIDHGKTSLIKVLTNMDTDKLMEEKKRGISIDLGFAFFDLPSKKRAGIIDVPGHEKFIKNMIAGATGIDVVLLVIACDEGIMPQTREHIEILSMLNISKGIVVLTKADLVDKELYELVKNEVKTELSNTFLKNAKILPFSSKTKLGYDDLLKEIDRLLDEDFNKNYGEKFRMPIDRCFTVSGFGTVVTGTIISGTVKLNDNVLIYPKEIVGKIRNIQVYEENKQEAYAGQRCALNISGIKKEDIERGYVVAHKDTLTSSSIVDCKLYSLNSVISNGQRIRFFHGASEIIGRIYILDKGKSQIDKNSETYVQIRLEKSIVSLKDDRYVIRNYSPMVTIGGGYIIEPIGKKTTSNKVDYLKNLKVKEENVGLEYIVLIIKNSRDYFLTVEDICNKYLLNKEKVIKELENINKEIILTFEDKGKKYFIHRENLNRIYKNIEQNLETYHSKNKFKFGMLKEELRSKLNIETLNNRIYQKVLNYYEENKLIKLTSKYVSLFDFNVNMKPDQEILIKNILQEYREKKYIPPKIKELKEKFKSSYFMEIHNYLEESNILYKINSEMYLLEEDFIYAKNKIVDFIKNNGSIKMSEVKEIISSNRKYLISLMEHLDELKITLRKDDVRVLAKKD